LILTLIAQDTVRTINIGCIWREIRFYGDTAVLMLAWIEFSRVVPKRSHLMTARVCCVYSMVRVDWWRYTQVSNQRVHCYFY
jgi:hypothetical protein